MTLLYIIIGVLLIIVFVLLYIVIKSNIEYNEGKKIKFSELMELDGDYGMKIIDSPLTSSYSEFYVEFKVISEVSNVNNSKKLNIKVINVSPVKLEEKSGSGYNKSMELLYREQWITNSSIYWYSDKDSRKRDEVIKDLLKDEDK